MVTIIVPCLRPLNTVHHLLPIQAHQLLSQLLQSISVAFEPVQSASVQITPFSYSGLHLADMTNFSFT